MRLCRVFQWVGLTLALALASGCTYPVLHTMWNKTADWLAGRATIHLEVLEPAYVMVPPHVQTVAVLDRSQAIGLREGALGAIEGALTGETIGADQEGRAEAMRGLMDTLGASPRFRVIQPIMSRQEAESGIFNRELSWEAARRICRRADCEGIVSLEAFDSNSALTHRELVEEVIEEGHKVQKSLYEVQRETRVVAAWRLYDIRGMIVLDQLHDYALSRTWHGKSESYQEALSKLPSLYETVRHLGLELGQGYGRRIAPSYADVERKFYSSGDPRLRDGKSRVEANDWRGAAMLWEAAAREPNSKLRGQALFNLALAREVEGKLEGALALARKAATDLNNRQSRDYVRILEQRIDDRERLERQMAPPAAPPKPPLRP